MTEQESARLHQEIARLNGIIDVLVIQSRASQEEIARLKAGNASPNVLSSTHENVKGITNDISSTHENVKGIINDISSIDEKVKGITDDISSTHEKVKGITDDISSTHEKVRGITNVSRPLPGFVEPSEDMVWKVALKLKPAGIKKVRSSTLRSMAIIILKAHNKQDCSHQQLRTATGLSDGGIAKLLMAMKKHGLIFREGFKRFGLTVKAQQVLASAIRG